MFPKPARHRQILAEFPATAALTPSRRADDRFDEFVLAIAGELSARKLIDYRARRMALLDWELDEQTWQHLVAYARADRRPTPVARTTRPCRPMWAALHREDTFRRKRLVTICTRLPRKRPRRHPCGQAAPRISRRTSFQPQERLCSRTYQSVTYAAIGHGQHFRTVQIGGSVRVIRGLVDHSMRLAIVAELQLTWIRLSRGQADW